MGAWSHEPFGNDSACDWAFEFREGKDLSAIESTLDAVLSVEDEYLEADLASEAVAAVEVLAKLMGKGTQADAYTEKLDDWIRKNPQHPSAEIRQKASAAIERIGSSNSELSEMWAEGEHADAWKASLQRLAAAVSV